MFVLQNNKKKVNKEAILAIGKSPYEQNIVPIFDKYSRND